MKREINEQYIEKLLQYLPFAKREQKVAPNDFASSVMARIKLEETRNRTLQNNEMSLYYKLIAFSTTAAAASFAIVLMNLDKVATNYSEYTAEFFTMGIF